MKFSVLLPTRNGGPFLENCIRSILEQGYGDMELVISDNANTDNTPEIIQQFSGDSRVKTLRQETPVSVTDNWNNALSASSGDYILMMGDDDYLLPGYFHRMEKILDNYKQPDCVLHNAYSYVAPGSIADNLHSFYSESHFQFGDDLTKEGLLTPEQRSGIVRDMFNFKVRIPLNMQTTLVARKAFSKVGGGVFQKPFPDHYALNSLLLTAPNWVFSPEKLLVVGVSPKSFGHYVYSNKQSSGLSYLGINADFPGRLPGNELLNGMHVWLDLLKQNYPVLLKNDAIDRAGYVRRQFYAWFMQRKLGAITTGSLLTNLGLLSPADWLGLAATVFDKASWARLLRVLFQSSKKSDAEAQWHSLRPLEGVRDMRQFDHWLAQRDMSMTMDSPPLRNLQDMRIGYVPYSQALDRPGDRRRFAYYASKRGLRFEIADPEQEYDLVILSARADVSVWSRYSQAKLVYDLIDSYFAIPRTDLKGRLRGLFKFLSRQSRYLQLDYWKAIAGMCARADAVVCSTDEQRQDILKFCPNVHIVLDAHMGVTRTVKSDYRAGQPFRIVWEGLPQTLGSLALIRPVLDRLRERHPIEMHIVTDSEYFRCMGQYGKTNTLAEVQRILPDVHFHEWKESDCADIICACDLAVIPLSLTDPFAAGKPENKLLLFWRMAMPVVTSASPAYVRAMRSAGMDLTARNEADWLATLERLLGDEAARRGAGTLGKAYTEREFSEASLLGRWDAVFSSLGFRCDTQDKGLS